MSWRERVLLVLTVVGFLVPNAMVSIFFIDHGLDISAYLNGWVQTLPSAQLVADLIVAFALWAAWEGRRLRMPNDRSPNGQPRTASSDSE